MKNVHVVFSSFGSPVSNPLIDSLRDFETSRICITSEEFAESWANIDGVSVYRARGNPVGNTGKFYRYAGRKLGSLRGIDFYSDLRKVRRFRDSLCVPHNLRHYLYLEALWELPEEDFVFLCDSRDLIFQVSPDFLSDLLIRFGGISVFDEGDFYFKGGAPQDFKSSPANVNWVRSLLNDSIIPDELLSFGVKILNSGFIAGTVGELKILLEATTRLLSDSREGGWSLLDQAALNVAVYCDPKVRNLCKIYQNGEIVLNMCGVVSNEATLANGVLKINERTIPVIHQFDRFGNYSHGSKLVLDRRKYMIHYSKS